MLIKIVEFVNANLEQTRMLQQKTYCMIIIKQAIPADLPLHQISCVLFWKELRVNSGYAQGCSQFKSRRTAFSRI